MYIVANALHFDEYSFQCRMINNTNKRMGINTESRDGEYPDMSRRCYIFFIEMI